MNCILTELDLQKKNNKKIKRIDKLHKTYTLEKVKLHNRFISIEHNHFKSKKDEEKITMT